MSEGSFKQYWIGRKQIVQYWDAKSEELKHMATWFQAWAKSLDRISAQLADADRVNERLKARLEQTESECTRMRDALEVFNNRRKLAYSLRAESPQIAAFVEAMGQQMDTYFPLNTPGVDSNSRVRKLEAVAEAAQRLDSAVAEFGLEPELVREVYQHFHDALSALDQEEGGGRK